MKKILLVEDESHLLKSLKGKLADKGYDVLSVSSYDDALRLGCSYKDKLHLGIIDLDIPKSKDLSTGEEDLGIELIRDLHDEGCKFGCIVFSGLVMDVDRRRRAREYGAKAIIRKQEDRDYKELLFAVSAAIPVNEEYDGTSPVTRGPLELTKDEGIVLVSGQVVSLSCNEHKLLSFLYKRTDVVSVADLIKHLYKDEVTDMCDYGEDDKYIKYKNRIQAHIKNTRNKIKTKLGDSNDTNPIVHNNAVNGYYLAWPINH